VYGEKQFAEKLIPKFIVQLLQGKSCTIHGNGYSKRSFIHVKDVANAFDVILHKGNIKEIYNIGTDNEYTVNEIATMLKELLNKKEIENEIVRDRNFNDQRYFISSEKLKQLGWHEQVTFLEGLKETCKFYRENMNEFWTRDVLENAIKPHPS